jgi:hypothetical protein
MMKRLVVAASLASAALLSQAGTVYTSEAAFLLAAGAVTTESFESAPGGTPSNLSFGGLSVSCAGATYCPSFFGTRTGFATDGSLSVFFATPSTITFTFAATNAFAIDVIGLGTQGATDMSMLVSNGDNELVADDYTGGSFASFFVGYTSTTAFTSVTFSATARDDGIDFDRLQLGTGNTVPEPSALALAVLALGIGGAVRARRH